MEQEYTISVGWKIFYGLMSMAMAAFGAFLLGKLPGSNNPIAGSIVCLLLFTGGALLALYLIKRKVVISDTAILVKGMFNSRELLNDDIKGFRIEDKVILIEALQAGRPKLVINDYSSIGKSQELIKSLHERYQNLNLLDYQNELNIFLQNEELGTSEEDRKDKLKRAWIISAIYNTLAFVSVIITFIFVNAVMGSQVVLILSVIYPLIGISIILLSNGLIKLVTKKTSPYYHIYIGIFFPSIILLVKSAIDFNILRFNYFWLPFLVITTAVSSLVYFKGLVKSPNKVKGQEILLLIIAGVYSFGLTRTINCEFDWSSSKIYNKQVISSYVTSGKRRVCHIVVSPWDGNQKSRDIIVDSNFFNTVSVGQSINVNFKKGLLMIPWFYVTK